MFYKNNILNIFSKKLYLIKHSFDLCKIGIRGNVSKFILLIIFSLLEGISDTLPVLILIPFISLISDPQKFWSINQVKNLSKFNFINQPSDLLIPSLLIFISLILFNTFLKLFTITFSNYVKASIGHKISKIAYEKIIFSNYEFQLSNSSSKIIDEFYISVGAALANIDSSIDSIRSSFTIILLTISLFIINKEITIYIFLICGLTYLSTAIAKSKILAKNGRILKIAVKKQTDLIQESWGYKKNIILENNQNIFLRKYSYYNTKHLFAKADINSAISKPKFIIEGSFILIIGSLAFFLKTSFGVDPLPILGSMALGLQKLLPNVYGLFQIYSSMIARYERSKSIKDLINNTPQDLMTKKSSMDNKICFNKLELEGVYYKYPKSEKLILNNIYISIKSGEKIGIIGKTGSGKSTLINLIMGLIKPTIGSIKLNGISITDIKNENKLINYRQMISHVPQSIFVNDVSILENIAFGENILDINFDKVIEVCKAVKIYDFIKNSEKGFYSIVGERGIKISGGQIQRLALASALYKKKKILILDEATSALDNQTEKEVIDSIRYFDRELTIISIAHRLSTLNGFDRIIRVDKGKLYTEKNTL